MYDQRMDQCFLMVSHLQIVDYTIASELAFTAIQNCIVN